MLAISKNDRVFISLDPVDFRKQIKGLIIATQNIIKQNPYSGHYFVFINKRKLSIKILHHDRQGYWLHQKVLSIGRFTHWPNGTGATEIDPMKLLVLLSNGDPESAAFAEDWIEKKV